MYCGEVAIVAEVRAGEIGSAEVRRAGRILCDKVSISLLDYDLLRIVEANVLNSSKPLLLIYFVCRCGCRHVCSRHRVQSSTTSTGADGTGQSRLRQS